MSAVVYIIIITRTIKNVCLLCNFDSVYLASFAVIASGHSGGNDIAFRVLYLPNDRHDRGFFLGIAVLAHKLSRQYKTQRRFRLRIRDYFQYLCAWLVFLMFQDVLEWEVVDKTKKLICVMLAALLLFSAGCGQTPGPEAGASAEQDEAPTLFADLTGIPQDKIVMYAGEMEVPAELYFYWLCYVCSSLEYNILSDYNNYGMYRSCVDSETKTIDWTAEYAGIPLMSYARSQTESTIQYYMSIEALAQEKNVGLSTANRVDMENDFQNATKELGEGLDFGTYLKMLGISRESFDRISAASYLYMNLLDLVFDEDSDLYLSEEDYNQYATYADHILISSQNMKTGESLPPEEVMEKYKLAEELLEQLRGSEDPAALFAELADEHSEDPGRTEHPTGYIYTANTMVPEFESAAALLEPGEISEIVQSDYGFHIILRRDLVAALREDESRKVDIAKTYLDQLLAKQNRNAAVTYDECLEDMDWVAFYTDYIAAVDRLAAELEPDQES